MTIRCDAGIADGLDQPRRVAAQQTREAVVVDLLGHVTGLGAIDQEGGRAWRPQASEAPQGARRPGGPRRARDGIVAVRGGGVNHGLVKGKLQGHHGRNRCVQVGVSLREMDAGYTEFETTIGRCGIAWGARGIVRRAVARRRRGREGVRIAAARGAARRWRA